MLLATALFAQLATAQPVRHVAPVLAFPEPGMDDTAAYQGYQTRFFRDIAGNTVQVYLDREGRVVNLWADAEDESLGLSVRDARGAPATLRWGSDSATIGGAGRRRTIEYDLAATGTRADVGLFLLGSMRVERDFQYAGRQRDALAAAPFRVAETDDLVRAIESLPPAERARHLALLGARDVATLRARLQPAIATTATASMWRARVVQPSLDARDTLVLELIADPRRVVASRVGRVVSLRARSGGAVLFTVRITTTGRALTPLAREEIFTPAFLAFLADAKRAPGDAAATRARWLERQTRGVELLVSREKLMAGLPNYATYFGRDMLVTALMMRSIWRDQMSEFAIAAALRKLGPAGDVSHEEALGGQAVREGSRDYATLVADAATARREGRRAAADSLLGRARAMLGDLRRTRENYHMIDDELQLAVLAGRWLGDSTVSRDRKRAFLLDSSDGGGTRAERLLRELALVSRMTGAYAREPVVANLVSFARRDSTHWSSASWRDSGAGYANGRWAMDVNAIWAPHALESIATVLESLRGMGISADSIARAHPGAMQGPIAEWSRDSLALRRAVETWWGAERHFEVHLAAAAVHDRVAARVAAMPAAERDYWAALLARTGADRDSLSFLALALDADEKPIGVANSDVATRLFLGDAERGDPGGDDAARERRDVALFTRAYPVGLLITGVGPVVANDAYAPPTVWRDFERDSYHGPKVIWGREVNLYLLGVANRIGDGSAVHDVPALRAAFEKVLGAVEASGFHSELWSYEVRDGRVVPARYGIASDVQLWSTTDLAVQFARARMK